MVNAVNWNQRQFRMKARFRKRGVWSPVDGSRHRPSDGDLMLSLDDIQQVHVDGTGDDPVAI